MELYEIDVEAMEPDALENTEAVTVTRSSPATRGTMGEIVTLSAPTENREALLRYVYDHWVGDGGDIDWFIWATGQLRTVHAT